MLDVHVDSTSPESFKTNTAVVTVSFRVPLELLSEIGLRGVIKRLAEEE